jgi:hypothetical protein
MFLPETIDLGHSEKYILSIRTRPDSFVFSICEPDAGKNYCLRETTFSANDNYLSNIQRIIFDLNFLTQRFKKTNVVVVSKDYELVPASYFDKKQKEGLYNFTHSHKAGRLMSGYIADQDVVALFDIEKDIFEFLSRNLWVPEFYHHSNLLINFFEKRNRNGLSSMYLNFHDNFLDVFCFSDSKLIHALSYEGESVNNQLYYILKLWEQCGFDQVKDYVFVSGEADKFIVSRLYDYIKNVEFLNAPGEIHFWSEDAQKAPLDLLALSL